MDEVSLYRKYRPHNFDSLVGQDHIRTTLMNALKSARVSHAYLFSGPRGTGKTSSARLLAKALMCTNLLDGYEPCNECEFCKDVNDGRLIDVIEIDAASNRGIDEVRDLKEKINFAPTRAKCKVYIIDEVHMMTKEAFNALLKTLEEPPTHVYFVLATTEVHKIPETILSRCQRFDFKRISGKALLTRLSFIAQKEGVVAEDKALEVIGKYVDGGMRDAIGLFEQLTTDSKLTFEHVQEILGVTDFSLLEDLFTALMENRTRDALKIAHDMHDQGSDLKQFLHEFVDLLRIKMLDAIADDAAGELPKRLVAMIEIFQEAQQRTESYIPQLPLEIAIIKVTGPVEEKIEVRQHQAVKAPEKKTIEASPAGEGILTLESVKEKWPRVVERVKTPALRMSLKNAVPVALELPNLTLEFATKFHKDKVMEHDHRVELEEILHEMFQNSLKIAAQVKELEIKPVVDEALEIFGGELVD